MKSVCGAKSMDYGGSMESDNFPLPYIRDGLIAIWDGEYNSLSEDGEWIHDDNAIVWRDLTGNHDLSLVENAYVWTGNSLRIPSGNAVVGEGNGAIRCKTLEIVGTYGNTSTGTFMLDLGYNTLGLFAKYNQVLNAESRRARYFISKSADKNTLGTSTCVYGENDSDPALWAAVFYRNGVSYNPSGITAKTSETCGHLCLRSTTGQWEPRCIRLYNRRLSEEEVVYNAAIDKERFGL